MCSTYENRHFGASFMSVGGVETKILMSPKWTPSDLFRCSGTLISRLLHPLQTWNLHQNVFFHECYTMTLSQVYLSGYRKNLKIKIYPPCFEGILQKDYNGIYFPLHIPYGVGEIHVWNFFGRDPTLSDKCMHYFIVLHYTYRDIYYCNF